MGEVIQALSEIGLKVTRDCMNKTMQKQVAAKLPFSVLEVNLVMDNSTAVSSLQGMDGAKKIPPSPPIPLNSKLLLTRGIQVVL
jgi:hypothetical protein